MNIEESKNQIETLIEAWQLDEADLNQTDINAMQVLLKENQELKKQLEDKYEKVGTLTNEVLYEENTKLINQQKEFIEYLEKEKDRLAISTSHTYEDSLGKTRLVNEDIYNEVDKILSKYKEIIGGKE